MKILSTVRFLIASVGISLAACHSSVEPQENNWTYAGGETTVFSTGPDAYTLPLANLNKDGLQKHLEADAMFAQQFVTEPAERFGGLGPIFNQNACESCHIRNGKSAVPAYSGDPSSGLLLRLGTESSEELPGFGNQLQTKAVFGFTPEGKISIEEREKIVRFADGMETKIRELQYGIQDSYIPLPASTRISPRMAQAVYGLGLLEAVPEEEILALADENDRNGDGISGRPNWVWDKQQQSIRLGRFGWKAAQPSALQQSAAAAHNDMGLSNPLFPEENCTGQNNCGGDEKMDISNEELELFTFYFQTLGVPAPRNQNSNKVKQGRLLFFEARCNACHVPTLHTGPHPIRELAYQTIHPYTDLLLHDMGEDLADHRPEGKASGREWRTPPLWGIGLTQVVNPQATFLHDGRARTIEEAILWHGGEAEYSKQFYMKLPKSEREKLLAFVESL
ncbi:MAG: thiol oxidoreductase [Chitinophagales bacterium]|nr:MAG: thiol oxidoreductase [Chitinophagales bacterium]